MADFLERWTALPLQRKLLLAGVLTFGALLLLGMVRLAFQQDMALLYGGLEPGAADQIVNQLETAAIPYELRGDTIYVPQSQRDRLRLSLAGQGLPNAGGAGYELLDGLSGFGTTTAMFDAAYWRAKEGELARTILSSAGVTTARVHIAREESSAFARMQEVTAAVTVSTAQPPLPLRQAEAIRYLVASAVPGLAPQNVSVIDSESGIILMPGDMNSQMSVNPFDERAAQLKVNIERLLSARVGNGRALVEVMIDADLDSETVTERVLDPSRRVAVEQEVEEETDQSAGAGGAVTVASNLPDGDAGNAAGQSEAQSSRTRQRTSYDVSEVLRERIKPAGQIRRISVAVLVDGVSTLGEDGQRIWTPRSDDELEALAELVRSAMGYDAARGDTVTLQSLEFPATTPDGTEALPSPGTGFFVSAMPFAQMAFLGMILLALGVFVVRPMLAPGPLPPELGPVPEIEAANLSPTGEVIRAIEANSQAQEMEISPPSKLEILQKSVEEQRDGARLVLQNWIELAEERI